MTTVNLATPEAAAKHELLSNNLISRLRFSIKVRLK
jgi:hypothetical protein